MAAYMIMRRTREKKHNVTAVWLASLLILTLVCFTNIGQVKGFSLNAGFYAKTCPEAECMVRSVIEKAVQRDPRMAASLLRMQFHDCFVQGCDASVLLDDNSTFIGEKTAGPNVNSLRGFDVVDEIKSALEKACPRTVSCADIIAIAARDSVVLSGGPSWNVMLGRRDSLGANKAEANQNLPSPLSNVSTLVKAFANVGLSTTDMVVLSGAHTIGKARCVTFSSRLQGAGANVAVRIQSSLRNQLSSLCGGGQIGNGNNGNITAPLDVRSTNVFDNQYFKNLMNSEGLLTSDQVLFSTPGVTQKLVWNLSNNQKAFFEQFKISMVNMGSVNPLTGQQGEIRSNCRRTN